MFLCVFLTAAGRVTTNEELEDMLESGNPSIFTSDVRFFMDFWVFLFRKKSVIWSRTVIMSFCLLHIKQINVVYVFVSDHFRLTNHTPGLKWDRVPSPGHYTFGVQHQRASCNVHGHGDAGRNSGNHCKNFQKLFVTHSVNNQFVPLESQVHILSQKKWNAVSYRVIWWTTLRKTSLMQRSTLVVQKKRLKRPWDTRRNHAGYVVPFKRAASTSQHSVHKKYQM